MIGGRRTQVVDEVAELYGQVTRSDVAPLREIAQSVFGRGLPRRTRLRIVEDAIQLHEGSVARWIRGYVSRNRRNVYIVRDHLGNPVLLADEVGHVMLPGVNPNRHHLQTFDALVRSNVSLSFEHARELVRALQAANRGL